jgi:predicted DNA-binding transcriptional regulator YafY
MNRIERLTAILLLLQEKPYTSLEIAHHFEISKRTVLRDIQALSEMGVPVVAQPGAGGGYSLPDGYLLAPLPLTLHEAFLLRLALRTITRLPELPFLPERSSLLAKLEALLPQPAPPDLEQLLAVTDLPAPERGQAGPFLEPLLLAAQQQQWVEVSYQSTERLSTQHLLPHRLRLQNGYWYCFAYALEHQAERTYRVDRIRALTPANLPLQATATPEPRPYAHPSHPEVVVKLTARGVSYVESEPHLGPQLQRYPDQTGFLAFRCPPSELDWFARYFAGLGSEAEVCAPPELRQRLQQLGQKLAEQYG